MQRTQKAVKELQGRFGDSAGADSMGNGGGSSGAGLSMGKGEDRVKVGRNRALYAEKAKGSYEIGKIREPNLEEATQIRMVKS